MARLPADASSASVEHERSERDERIWKLHVAGRSNREIGAIVGLSHTGVMKILQQYRGDSPTWSTDQVRQVEDDRLRRLLLALDEGIESRDVAAISEARKISESRRKLYGADGPVTVNVNHSEVSAVDAAFQELVAEMNEANARREAKLRDSRSG